MVRFFKYLLILKFTIGASLQAAPIVISGLVTNNSVPEPRTLVYLSFPIQQDTIAFTDTNGEYTTTINPNTTSGSVTVSYIDKCGDTITTVVPFGRQTQQLRADIAGCVRPSQIIVQGQITNPPSTGLFLFCKSAGTFGVDSVWVDSLGLYRKSIAVNGGGSLSIEFDDCNQNLIGDSASFNIGDTLNFNFNYCSPPKNAYFGKVLLSNQPISNTDAFILVYKYEENTQQFSFYDTVALSSNGRFSFPNNGDANFLLKVMPADNRTPFAATYYSSGALWSNNTSFSVGPHNNSIELVINVIPKAPGRGNASVNGTVNIDKTLLLPGFSGKGIHLLDENLSVVDFTYADVNGDFQFNNIDRGNYFIWLDQCGIPTNPIKIEISNSNDKKSGYVITGNELGIGFDEFVGFEDFQQVEPKIYPNPFRNEIQFSGIEGHVQIFNALGNELASFKLSNLDSKIETTDTWESGLYVVKILSKNKAYSVLLLKE